MSESGKHYTQSIKKSKVDVNHVDHPDHYNSGSMETIEVIRDWGLDKDFYLGNAVKYLSRIGKKDPSAMLVDLEKAIFYLQYKSDALRLQEGLPVKFGVMKRVKVVPQPFDKGGV